MRPFDWEKLFREQRVEYVTTGANVKRGELAIRCPFCGSADPSHHMGLSIETGWWSCWRNRSQHSGKSPLRLIMRLLGVPYGRARELAGLGDDYVDPEGFDAAAARFMKRDGGTGRAEEVKRRVLRMDESLEPIGARMRTRRHWNYLYGRGFDLYPDDVDHLCREYGLMAGTRGRWSGRVVAPYYQDGDLMTWTARAIGDAAIRYLDLSVDESVLPAKETLFNHDAMLCGGRVLVLQEGPFDALKTDFYGKAFGVRAVALSTNSIKPAQAFLLQSAVGRFERVAVMLDNASALGIGDSMRMKAELCFLPNVFITPVPDGAKDGGDLTPAQVIKWAKAL